MFGTAISLLLINLLPEFAPPAAASEPSVGQCQVAAAFTRNLLVERRTQPTIFDNAAPGFFDLLENDWWSDARDGAARITPPPPELIERARAHAIRSAVQNCLAVRRLLSGHGVAFGRNAVRIGRQRSCIISFSLPVLNKEGTEAVLVSRNSCAGSRLVLLVKAAGEWRVVGDRALAIF